MPNTLSPTTVEMPQIIDKQMTMYANQRKSFERRWYDNNFFDDGFHFRYVSRTTGKIVDLSNRATMNIPQRAIPKASRQIRGVANLLMAPEYVPVIYPEKVARANFQSPQEYDQAMKMSKSIAQRAGHWVTEEFKKQEIEEKIIWALLLACKHGVSWVEIYKDAVEEKIRTDIFDAFEIYCMGNLSEYSQSPSMIKATPRLISEIKADESFDPNQRLKISPDNKYASSEIKQAYMQSRFGSGQFNDQTATLIQKEAFAKEYVTEENMQQIVDLANDPSVYQDKKLGDMVMRHTFSAGGVWLLDEYVSLPDYPFVPIRLEPGPIYQVPLIERFIPANKTLDLVMSRIERYINTMVTGTWLTRAGEDLQITNIPGGQKLEYKNTAPVQGQVAPLPAFVFNFINKIESLIEEQGASSAALNQLPEGVKSGVAIESIKSTEFSNLKISSMMLKQSIRRIAEKMLDIADGFIDPQTVYFMEKGEPQYFDVIGQKGMEIRQKLGGEVDATPLKKEYHVEIEVESGLGFTIEGKKQTMQQIIDFMIKMSQNNLLNPEAVKVVAQKLLETYQFGATQEFMEALDMGVDTFSEDQIQAIKVAVLETLTDSGVVGPQADQKLVDSTKVGTLETLTETGMIDNVNKAANKETPQGKPPSVSIGFKDLPPEGKTQAAAQAGIFLNTPQVINDEKDQSATSQG